MRSKILIALGVALLTTFAASVAGAQSQATGVFVYGGGADFLIVRHLSLRAEYRGLV